MITIDGITIDDNMLFTGFLSAPRVSTTQHRTVVGNSHVQANPLYGGKTGSIGTATQGGKVMGSWCQSVIDALKVVEQAADEVELDYHGDIYNIVITGSSEFEPKHINTPAGPNKAFYGQFFVTEV